MMGAKRIASLLVAALLIASLSACENTPAPATSSSTSSSKSTAEPSSSQPQELVAPAREYVKGTKTDTSYTSEFWGLQFIAPNDNIMMATDEQISEIMGIGVEALGTDPALAEQLEDAIGQYEMVAMDLKYGVALMMLSEELPLSFMTPEIYIEGMKQGVKQTGQNATVEYENDGNVTTETIGGKSFHMMSYTLSGEGTPTNHQSQRVHIDGKRVLVISLAYPPELPGAKEAAEATLAAITAIEPVATESSGSSAAN